MAANGAPPLFPHSPRPERISILGRAGCEGKERGGRMSEWRVFQQVASVIRSQGIDSTSSQQNNEAVFGGRGGSSGGRRQPGTQQHALQNPFQPSPCKGQSARDSTFRDGAGPRRDRSPGIACELAEGLSRRDRGGAVAAWNAGIGRGAPYTSLLVITQSYPTSPASSPSVQYAVVSSQ